MVLEALRAAGAPEDVIQRAQGQEPEGFEVWPENEGVVEAFLQLATCWVVATPPMGEPFRIGLPAVEIESTLRLLGVPKCQRIDAFRDIREMERVALSVFNE
nr:DUF1799 domain-containing protein [Alcaligenes ammonioxydans]